MSNKKELRERRLINYILILAYWWMAVNLIIAMYVKIETEQMREVMGLSVLFSMAVILLASLGKFLLFMTDKLQSKLQSQLSKRDPRSRH